MPWREILRALAGKSPQNQICLGSICFLWLKNRLSASKLGVVGNDFPFPDLHTRYAVLTGDNPIKIPQDDVLGRNANAQNFARHVLAFDSTEGVVVGVLGPWGSGKTSFINLARNEFEQAGVSIFDFNPWMFSGAAHLVESFFIELASQLKVRDDRLAKVGKYFENYGKIFSGMGWLPLIGPWLNRSSGAAKILSKLFPPRQEGIGDRRCKLEQALSALDKPIVVVLDDIDRLETSEIRDVFKLVRLTANFPNIIYIVAFDRDRVEKALDEEGLPGRYYLEKILQEAIDLPVVPSHVLHQQITSALDNALDDIENTGPLDGQVWPDVFVEIIRPLVQNMRDVRRYAATIHGTVISLDGKIALADLLALEAIRMFLPDVFKLLHGAIEGLTADSDSASDSHSDPDYLKAQVNGLIKAAGDHSRVFESMIKRLFPAGERYIDGSFYDSNFKKEWLRERRVAHEDILRLYLERIANENLQAVMGAEEAWQRIANRDTFDEYLRSIDSSKLQDVIASLEMFGEQFVAEHVVPGTIVLLNLLPLPERQRGMFDLTPRVTVLSVVSRLLKSLNDPTSIEKAVRQILPELKSLSSKLVLIGLVGCQKDVGHKLVPENIASEFEKDWREEVRSTSVDDLVDEHELLWVFLYTKQTADPSESPLNIDCSPKLTLALLRAARSETLSQAMGSWAVQRSPRLAWDDLIELYGDEATLRERIENLKAANLDRADELLKFADKYLDEYRHVGSQ